MKLKRMLAAILCLAFLLGMVPATAVEATPVETPPAQETVLPTPTPTAEPTPTPTPTPAEPTPTAELTPTPPPAEPTAEPTPTPVPTPTPAEPAPKLQAPQPRAGETTAKARMSFDGGAPWSELYTTLEECIAALEWSTDPKAVNVIEIMSDGTITAPITPPVDRSFTLRSSTEPGAPTHTLTRGASCTGDLFTVNSGTTLALSNVTLNGGSDGGALVNVASGGTLNLTGNSVVAGNTGGNVVLAKGTKMNLAGHLTGGANVCVKMVNGVAGDVIATNANANDLNYLHSDDPNLVLALSGTSVVLKAKIDPVASVVGGDGYATLQEALDAVPNGGIVELLKSITQTTLLTAPGRSFTLQSRAGGSYTITRGAGCTGDLLTMAASTTLNLSNIIFDGNKASVTSTGALIKMAETTNLNLKSGAKIQNNKTTGQAGGIWGLVSGTQITMETGAVITGNEMTATGTVDYAGGATVDGTNGKFIINGGEISYNTATTGGGGISGANVEFISGTIHHNKGSNGGGIRCKMLTMNGGTISNNEAAYNGGGVSTTDFSISGGTISNNKSELNGAGLFSMSGTGAITGGSITGNAVNRSDGTVGMGGGIVIYNCKLSLSGNPQIKNNTSAGKADNLYIYDYGNAKNTINITGALTGGVNSIGITLGNDKLIHGTVLATAGSGYTMIEADKANFFDDTACGSAVLTSDGKTIYLKRDHFYVSATGNDTATGSYKTPYQTLQKAYDQYTKGDSSRGYFAYACVMDNLPISATTTINVDRPTGFILQTTDKTRDGSPYTGAPAVLTRQPKFTGEFFLLNTTRTFATNSLNTIALDTLVLDGNGTVVTAQQPLIRMSGTGGAALNIGPNAVLRNNKNNSGDGTSTAGGVVVAGANNTCTVFDNASITGNSSSFVGGGVSLCGTTPKLTMSGTASITGNTATSGGGGVCIYNKVGAGYGLFMTGGSITDNTISVADGGGGVDDYTQDANSHISVAGAATITGNSAQGGTTSNVYLRGSQPITVTDALTGSVGIKNRTAGVIVAKPGGSPAHTITAAEAARFTADGGALVGYLKDSNVVLDKPLVRASHDTGTTWAEYASLQDAINDIPGDDVNSNIIEVLEDISTGEIQAEIKSFTLRSSTLPEATGKKTITRTMTNLLNIWSDSGHPNVNVKLENITLSGLNADNKKSAVLLWVHGGAHVTLAGGASLQDNDISGTLQHGAGAFVEGATLTMELGSSIKNNKAGKTGGGVFVDSGTFTMSGGSITGNTAATWGGGVNVADSTFTMTGGSITGNICPGGGAGGVSVNAGGILKLSGNVTITGNSTAATGGSVSNVYLTNTSTIKLTGPLDTAAAIGVTMGATTPVIVAVGDGYVPTAADASKFKDDKTPAHRIALYGSEIKMGVLEARAQAVGSATWTNYESLEAAFEALKTTGGTVELLCNLTQSAALTVPAGKVFTLQSDSSAANTTNAKYTLTRGATATGHLFTVSGANTSLTLKNITLDGDKTHIKNNAGALIYATTNAALTLGGGAILQNNLNTYAKNFTSNGGGAIHIRNSTLHLLPGSILQNNEGQRGGAIYTDGSSLNMSGGTIIGNTGRQTAEDQVHGAIFINAEKNQLSFSGGIIQNNIGGGIAADMDCPINLSGSISITGNTATAGGAVKNVYLSTFNSSVAVLTIAGALTGQIGITAATGVTPPIVAKPGAGYTITPADLAKFTADDSAGTLMLSGGNIVLGTPVARTSNDGGTTWATYISLQEAIGAVTTDTTKNHIVELLADNTPAAGITVTDKTFTLRSDTRTANQHHTLSRGAFNLFSMSGTADVTLENITFKGKNGGTTDTSVLIWAYGGSKLTINAGTTLRDNDTSQTGHYGSAICLEGTAAVNMTGGSITNNASGTGGGVVCLLGTGSFTMTGGSITDNRATNGAVDFQSGTLSVSGSAIITDNKAAADGLAMNVRLTAGKTINVPAALTRTIGVTAMGAMPVTVATYGSGVTPDISRFTDDKGAAAVTLEGSKVKFEVAEAKTSTDGEKTWTNYTTLQEAIDAVVTTGTATTNIVEVLQDQTVPTITVGVKTFTLQSPAGEVKTITNTQGKVAFNTIGRMTLKNITISGAEGATTGYHLFWVHGGGTLTMESGSTLQNNKSIGRGAAVFVGTDNSTDPAVFTMNSGKITGNTETNPSGGVVFVCNAEASFIMNGGEISGNFAPQGGGVYAGGIVKISGSAKITGNKTAVNGADSNVYLPTGKTITLTGTLADTAAIGVTTESTTRPVTIAVPGGNYVIQPADLAKFTADNAAQGVPMFSGKNIALGTPEAKIGTTNYATLQEALTSAATSDTVVLLKSIDLSGTLNVNGGKTITLKSEGTEAKIIKRATGNGSSMMIVDGSANLTMENIVLDGNASVDSIRILHVGGNSAGTVTLSTGAVLQNNKSVSYGGAGAYVFENGILNVSGGTVTGNTTTVQGGGIYVAGTLNLSGNSNISGNKIGNAANNIYLPTGKTINLTGLLTGAEKIGITTDGIPHTVAAGNGYTITDADRAKFTDDKTPGHKITLTSDNHLVLGASVAKTTNGTIVTNHPTLQEAIDAVTTTAEVHTVELLQDITAETALKAPTGKTFTLTGGVAKHTLKRGNASGSLLSVEGTGNLTLTNITLDGQKSTYATADTKSLVTVAKDATLTLDDGAVVRNNRIEGTSTDGNYGGGINSAGKLYMKPGSTISGNESTFWGGGVFFDGSMEMTGGKIFGNASEAGGGIMLSANSATGKLTITDGEITGNTVTKTGSAIHGGKAGSSIILGGNTVITNNIAKPNDYAGGGIFLHTGCTLTLTGGNVQITGNTQELSGNKTQDQNVLLRTISGKDDVITVTGALDPAAIIGVCNSKGINSIVATPGTGVTLNPNNFTDDTKAKQAMLSGKDVVFGDPEAKTSNDGEKTWTNYATLQEALNGIPTKGTGTVVLLKDITMKSADLMFRINSESNVTLKSEGTTPKAITRDTAYWGTMIIAGQGTQLTLQNITFNGSNAESSSEILNVRGIVTLATDALLKNNRNSRGNTNKGGGVYVEATGILNMAGGTITNNSTDGNGGGVYVDAGGKLNLSGNSKITGNKKSTADSNVYLEGNATMTLTGALTGGAAIGVTSGSADAMKTIAVPGGTPTYVIQPADVAKFTADNPAQGSPMLSGGKIVLGTPVAKTTNDGSTWTNYATVQEAIDAVTTVGAAHIVELLTDNAPATGITTDKTFTLQSTAAKTLKRSTATVAGSLFTVTAGGNVTLTNITLDGQKDSITETADTRAIITVANDATLTLNNGATVQNGYNIMPNNQTNNTENGAGINNKGNLFINAGSVISGNESVNWGGAVLTVGTVTMSGGTIRENKAGAGSGIMLYPNSAEPKLVITGGTIQNNTSTLTGSAIHGAIAGSSIALSGTAENPLVITGNRCTETGNGGAVYLYGNAGANLGSALSLSGAVQITGNTQATATAGTSVPSNIRLMGEQFVTLTALAETAKIGVTTDNIPHTVAKPGTGYTITDADRAKFTDDKTPGHKITLTSDNHLVLGASVARTSSDSGTTWTNYTELQDAITAVATSGTTTTNIVELLQTITVPTPILVTDKALTLRGATATTTINRGSATGALLKITGTGNVTLTNIILDGQKSTYPAATASIITAVAGTTLTLETGAKVQNGKMNSNSLNGSGINSAGTLNVMTGSFITGNVGANWGGGVYFSGTMNMSGGEISGNSAPSGAGIMLSPLSGTPHLNMTGGTITNNTSTINGSAIHSSGVTDSAIVLDGNVSITGNTTTNAGGGAIFMYLKGGLGSTLSVSGNVKITDNKQGTGSNLITQNVVLRADGHGDKITVTGTLTDTAQIGITKTGTVPFIVATPGTGVTLNPNNFTDDTGAYKPMLSGNDVAFGSPVACTINVSGTGTGTANRTYYDTLQKAIAAVTSGGTVELLKTITVTEPLTINKTFTLQSGIAVAPIPPVTTTTSAYVINRGGATGALLEITGTGNVTLSNLILDGQNKATAPISANTSLVTVAASGSLTLNDGAVLRNNTTTNGGGVNMTGGTLIMNGGSITGNNAANGGGVNMVTGTFTMTGGEISGNTASIWGGGVNVAGDTFTMTGGSITGNSLSGGNGGGVSLNGGKTLNLSGSPIITGNKKGNAANNIYLLANQTLNLTGLLMPVAKIGVTKEGIDLKIAVPGQMETTAGGTQTTYNITADDAAKFFDDSGTRAIGLATPNVVFQDAVAKVVADVAGTTTATLYPTLQAAVNAATTNDTVTLLKDTAENVTVTTTFKAIDWNGKVLTGNLTVATTGSVTTIGSSKPGPTSGGINTGVLTIDGNVNEITAGQYNGAGNNKDGSVMVGSTGKLDTISGGYFGVGASASLWYNSKGELLITGGSFERGDRWCHCINNASFTSDIGGTIAGPVTFRGIGSTGAFIRPHSTDTTWDFPSWVTFAPGWARSAAHTYDSTDTNTGVANNWYRVITPAVAQLIHGGVTNGFATLQEAINNCPVNDTAYIQMLENVTENITVDRNVYLDFNGKTLTGTVNINNGTTLYGMDSASDDYKGTSPGGIVGTVTGNLAANTETSRKGGKIRKYLQITEGNKHTFHRYNVSVVELSFHINDKIETANLNFKVYYQGDSKVLGKLTVVGASAQINSQTPTTPTIPKPGSLPFEQGYSIKDIAQIRNTTGILVNGFTVPFKIKGTMDCGTGKMLTSRDQDWTLLSMMEEYCKYSTTTEAQRTFIQTFINQVVQKA